MVNDVDVAYIFCVCTNCRIVLQFTTCTLNYYKCIFCCRQLATRRRKQRWKWPVYRRISGAEKRHRRRRCHLEKCDGTDAASSKIRRSEFCNNYSVVLKEFRQFTNEIMKYAMTYSSHFNILLSCKFVQFLYVLIVCTFAFCFQMRSFDPWFILPRCFQLFYRWLQLTLDRW